MIYNHLASNLRIRNTALILEGKLGDQWFPVFPRNLFKKSKTKSREQKGTCCMQPLVSWGDVENHFWTGGELSSSCETHCVLWLQCIVVHVPLLLSSSVMDFSFLFKRQCKMAALERGSGSLLVRNWHRQPPEISGCDVTYVLIRLRSLPRE